MIMEKFTLRINLSKLDKSRITERTFTNKDGQEIVVKEYSIDVVPLKNEEVIKEGDTWTMVKNCFAVDSPTKEEKQAKKKMTTLGTGIAFKNKQQNNDFEISPEDFPF